MIDATKLSVNISYYAGGIVCTILYDTRYQLGQSRPMPEGGTREVITAALADFIEGLTNPKALRATVFPPELEALRPK